MHTHILTYIYVHIVLLMFLLKIINEKSIALKLHCVHCAAGKDGACCPLSIPLTLTLLS